MQLLLNTVSPTFIPRGFAKAHSERRFTSVQQSLSESRALQLASVVLVLFSLSSFILLSLHQCSFNNSVVLLCARISASDSVAASGEGKRKRTKGIFAPIMTAFYVVIFFLLKFCNCQEFSGPAKRSHEVSLGSQHSRCLSAPAVSSALMPLMRTFFFFSKAEEMQAK